eukprot:2669824-Pyramimonas_sp.AAC.1
MGSPAQPQQRVNDGPSGAFDEPYLSRHRNCLHPLHNSGPRSSDPRPDLGAVAPDLEPGVHCVHRL